MVLPPHMTHELEMLSIRYGTPLYTSVLLPTDDFEPVCMTDRVGEVCMVIRRPDGRLLTAIKTTYPPGAHRLLTGGIHHSEQIFDALLREVAEETSLEVVVQMLLAVVEYQRATDHQPIFYTIAFLLDEVGGTLACVDPAEQHEAFSEIAVEQLPEQAQVIERVSQTFRSRGSQDWAAWGRFRAIIHRVVWTTLGAPVASS